MDFSRITCKTIWRAVKRVKTKSQSKRARTLKNKCNMQKKASTHLKTEQFTRVNGSEGSVTASANRLGLMAPATKAIGRTTRLMDGASFTMWMETSSMVNGVVTKPTATAPISTLTALSMKDTGLMTCRMARARRPGKTDPCMKASTAKATSMDRVAIFGAMAACIKANG